MFLVHKRVADRAEPQKLNKGKLGNLWLNSHLTAGRRGGDEEGYSPSSSVFSWH